ncbi:tetratricopeptide repeat 28-like [Paramuricea clavata]|uniref:Tetratricopeptide repeat 28-like n=1 Tax=Paramuricea clavata TaxID=317549 RepID=A0A7D9E461_PARCT|nr:tetratricopeptide repeat 28-like [Paramuricea clavata]
MESTTNTKSESSEFNELLSKGSDALSKGDLQTAEKHYSTALKLVSPERKTKEMRTCFEELGNIYLMKRKSGDDFTNATALYNAALARSTSTEDELKKHLISRIKEAERQFLSSILLRDSLIDFPDYENDIKHKDVLSTIRDSCKEIIRQVDFECDPGVMPLDEEQRVVLEKRRTSLISTLFRKISKDMIDFIQMLIEECTSVLGNAPCRFAVIGLGSLARNEMTPYSDMEFAILLEDGAETESNLEYFRNITRYFHLKVLNLGETILPSMGITSLNDFYSGDPARMWFFDDGPKGCSFDGAMPWASKYPLGRKETQTKEAIELIKTPGNMAALQSEQLAIKEGYHLADVLATSVFVTGDEELVKLYNVKVNESLQDPSDQDMLTNGSKRGFESLNEIVEDFSLYFKWSEAGKMFNVKKELYRFPSLVLNSLTFYYNLDSRNTWEIVDEMQKKQLITEDEAHNLNFILATASELRIRSYLGKDEQREKLTGLLSDVVELDLPESVAGKAGASAVDVEKAFHIPNPDIIVRFFMTYFPLQRAIQKLVLSKKLPHEGKMFSDHNLYDCR